MAIVPVWVEDVTFTVKWQEKWDGQPAYGGEAKFCLHKEYGYCSVDE